MKRIILFLLLLFTPFVVFAETCDYNISIDSIELITKSNGVKELQKASTNGMNINLYLSMNDVGDNAKYEIVIKNSSNSDYELDNANIGINDKYINYVIALNDGSNVIKAKSSKSGTLIVTYKKQVPDNKFDSGTYNAGKTIYYSSGIKNPSTGINLFISILFLSLIVMVSLYLVYKKRKINLMILLLGMLFIPIGVLAVCKMTIMINSNITIVKQIDCYEFNDTNSWNNIIKSIKAGKTSCMNVGDTKTVDMGSYGSHVVRITNKSNPSECNNNDFSQTACGFVVEFSDIIGFHSMNASDNYSFAGWPSTEMRTFINTDIYNALPADLKNGIIDTRVVSGLSYDNGNICVSNDKIYLLAPKEVWGFQNVHNLDHSANNSRQLDYYSVMGVTETNYENAKKTYDGMGEYWWLRSVEWATNDCFLAVADDGGYGWNEGYYWYPSEFGVSPAFRLSD